MQGAHTVDPAVDALRELRTSYRHLLHGESDIDGCRVAHQQAVQALADVEIARHLDEQLTFAHESDQGTVGFALDNLRQADGWMVSEERRLAQQLGFSERLVERMLELARRSLQSAKDRGETPPIPDQTADLIEVLERAHARALAVAEESRKVAALGQKPSKRNKGPAKREAFAAVSRDLVLVGFIVLNSKKTALFHHSLAISIGVAASDC